MEENKLDHLRELEKLKDEVFINAGHGGKDSGAVGYGLKESDVAYCIAARVATYLSKFKLTAKVFQYDGLEKICATANQWDADLFISVHCNAFNGSANGTETFHFYNFVEGKKLATSIHNQILKNIPTLTNRGVKEAVFLFWAVPTRADDFANAIAQGVLHFAGLTPDLVICPACGHKL